MSQATKKEVTQSTGRSSWLRHSVAGLVIVLGAFGAVALVIMIFGRCSGEEFSPDNFARRDFIYFRIPLLKLQVTPVYHNKLSSALVTHLKTNHFVASNSQSWELVSLHTGVADAYVADPMILCRYLAQRNAQHDLVWLEWSSDHPKLANVFWPVIAQVARAGLYVTIPTLFETARAATDPEELSVKLQHELVASALTLANGQYQLAAYDDAIQTCSFILAALGLEQNTFAKDGQDAVMGANGQRTTQLIEFEKDPHLAEVALKSLRLRSQAHAKNKKLDKAAADLRRIADLESNISTSASQREHEASGE